jgi:diguanylate cyclase (GGDEF)-like protein
VRNTFTARLLGVMGKSKSSNFFQLPQPSDRLVYLVTDDSNFFSHISQQITHFGYSIQHIRNIDMLVNVISNQNTEAIIIDISSSLGRLHDEDIYAKISALQSTLNNIIIASDHDDQVIRLKSIQAGGTAFFTKPINIVSLIDKLDSLHRNTSLSQHNRVLIIEDQHAVASYYQMILKMSGIDVQIVLNPDNVLEQMREFHPDLILMNTFLSDINAADLAKVIRQIDDFVSIPIIFLSNEDDFKKRIEALNLGGDDFLIKPIKATHLIAVVRSRLERSRILRSYMVRDSLTNLLNHTAFRNVLTWEVDRCKRENAKLALAMLDIDHFKMINDTYGHAAGDSALVGLSRLLQQRLRKSDIIGRYGGDEFVALLIDCEDEQALKIMDEIRVHFYKIEFCPNETKSLSLTFSCGISTFPKFRNVEGLSDSADRALYIAKVGERNKVVIAQS